MEHIPSSLSLDASFQRCTIPCQEAELRGKTMFTFEDVTDAAEEAVQLG